MAVPDFQSFFKPLLDVAADGKEHSIDSSLNINPRAYCPAAPAAIASLIRFLHF
jgi:hypothetical protein